MLRAGDGRLGRMCADGECTDGERARRLRVVVDDDDELVIVMLVSEEKAWAAAAPYVVQDMLVSGTPRTSRRTSRSRPR